MALQFYHLISSQSLFAVCKPKRNIQQILESKTKQHGQICCEAKTKVSQADSRRLTNIYQPTMWSHDFIQVLDDKFPVIFDEKVSELEKKVMALNVYFENGYFSTLQLLEHIDDIERLGLGYRFQNHIQRLLDLITSMYGINDELDEEEVSLHEASLRFWILRKHGYNVSQDFLRTFKNNHDGFIGCLQTDVKGLITLYEASHLAFMEESDLHEAKLFATEHLLKLKSCENDAKVVEHINQVLEIPLYHRMLRLQVRSYIEVYNTRQDANLHLLELATLDYNMTQRAYKTEVKELSKYIKHAFYQCSNINQVLEIPLYHRMLRLQVRSYIEVYNTRQDANLHLLELATLDYNMTQRAYKTEVKELSKWWKSTGLENKSGFIRDRLMECFFWTVGVVCEPQYYSCRVGLTKVCALITVIDDFYDVYGSLDELEIFTDAVKRWDINAMGHMPEYLQLGFGVLVNTISEMGSTSSKVAGEDITPILVKVWGELLEAFLVEAKWTQDKYIPSLEDYLDNAWRSVSGVVILTHGYFLINQEINNDVVEALEKYHDLMKWSSMIFRLYNDLGTSTDEIERGKNVNAIACYMHEYGVCEELARAYIKTLMDEAWRKLIKEHMASSQELANPFIEMAINLARISCCTYQYGDGHGAPDARAKDRIISVIIEPITIKEMAICV